MTGLTLEDVWLFSTVAQKVLLEGYDPTTFAVRLKQLHANDKRQFDRLLGICMRLDFVERLRYSSTAAVRKEDQPGYEYQVERLAAYLATTCIDVAAGKDEFTPYPVWLQRAASTDPRDSDLQSAADALDLAENRAEVATQLVKWTHRLHERYYDEQGVGRKFRRLVNGVPDWLKKWLAEAYILVAGDSIDLVFEFDRCAWLKWGLERRCKEIANYLFDLRNRYTHTVDYVPTLERGGGLVLTIGGVRYHFNRFYKHGSLDMPIERSVGLREGLAESDVIRLIVVVQVRRWLGIEDEEDVVERYWRRVAFRRGAYDLVRELEANLSIMGSWFSDRLYRRPMDTFKPARLEDKAIRALLDLPEPMPDLGMHNTLRQYAHHLDQVNTMITEFGAAGDDEEIEVFLREVVRSPYAHTLTYYLREIHRDLLQIVRQGYY